jgi:6-pyruvoyltetrahydropterin/6-carboxytetrahydropterin synthase
VSDIKYTIEKEFRFEAAHSLKHLPDDHKCHNLHGHSYRFVVRCAGPISERGFVADIDYADLSEIVNRRIVARFDHQNLDEFLSPSTAENLARFILEDIEHYLPVVSVDVYETATTKVTAHR